MLYIFSPQKIQNLCLLDYANLRNVDLKCEAVMKQLLWLHLQHAVPSVPGEWNHSHNIEPLEKQVISQEDVGFQQVLVVGVNSGSHSTVWGGTEHIGHIKTGRWAIHWLPTATLSHHHHHHLQLASLFTLSSIDPLATSYPCGPTLQSGCWWWFLQGCCSSVSSPTGSPLLAGHGPVQKWKCTHHWQVGKNSIRRTGSPITETTACDSVAGKWTHRRV